MKHGVKRVKTENKKPIHASSSKQVEDFWLNTRKLYKIWFSKDPAVALGIENELRLIRLRQDNPKAVITLVYSSSCLNNDALENLKAFCEEHNIRLVDFDTQVKFLLKNKLDKQAYALAQKEIQKTLTNEGGNLGAASDCARTLVPLVSLCGIYSDLDVHLTLNSQPKYVKVKSPILFPTELIEEAGTMNFAGNIDAIACTNDKKNSPVLGKKAVQSIRTLQKRIIQNYQARPLEVLYKPTIKGVPLSIAKFSDCGAIIDKFFDKNSDADIFAFRKYLQTFTIHDYARSLSRLSCLAVFGTIHPEECTEHELKSSFEKALKNAVALSQELSLQMAREEAIQFAKHLVSKMTVCQFTGPSILPSLLEDIMPKEISFQQSLLSVSVEPKAEWENFCKKINQYGWNANGLDKAYHSKNKLSELNDNIPNSSSSLLDLLVGTYGDQAWTEEGNNKKKSREEKMEKAATTIQTAWRNYQLKKKAEQEQAKAKKPQKNPFSTLHGFNLAKKKQQKVEVLQEHKQKSTTKKRLSKKRRMSK